MRLATLAAAILASCTLGVGASAGDDDPQKVLEEARDLAQRGKYEEALQKHLWFHDNALKHNPAMSGVRLSFALGYWVSLGEKYPRAREALVAIRDGDVGTIGDGRGTFPLFMDVSAINRELGEDRRTVELFKVIMRKQPGLATQCYRVAEKQLVAQREYGICSGYITDAPGSFEAIRQSRERLLGLAKAGQPSLQAYAERSFVEETCRLIAILACSDRKAEAEAIRERALADRADPRIRDAIEAALKASRPAPDDEAAIRAAVQRYVDARAANDPKAIGVLLTDDADQIVSDGTWRRGRDELVEGMLASTAKNPARRSIAVESVRFLAPDVAIADGRYKQEGGGQAREMWTAITLKRGAEGWRIAAIRNMLPTKP